MSNITLSDYVNIYRNALGGPRVSSINASTINISKINNIIAPTNNKFGFLGSNYKSNNHRILVLKTNTNFQDQAGPVIKVVSLNVKKSNPEIFTPATPQTWIYNIWKNSLLVDTLYSRNITVQLDGSIVIVNPMPKQSGGATGVELTLVSGRTCSITLKTSVEGVKISSIDNLPASLSFDTSTATISGVIFLTGTTVSNIIMSDGSLIQLTINVIPISVYDGI
ncbi:hypothetical protein ACJDU8_17085 [Clostridium sp. WILCCON 0269]|uniref:Uncharacterized protein n=1 Tax=Candidatus Clostridium eludens TaxID=3381663 RepID=A0ABW8SQ21_9CLOT